MTLSPPIHYSPDLEQIRPDERETITGLNCAFDIILETTAKDYGHAVRSVHAKAHAILSGRMVIHEGLPPELAQGPVRRPVRARSDPPDLDQRR